MDPVTIVLGVVALATLVFSTEGCGTALSAEERKGSVFLTSNDIANQGFTVKGPCSEYKNSTFSEFARMDAYEYAIGRSLSYWATMDAAGKQCRGRVIQGGVSMKPSMSFQIPTEICSDGNSIRGVVNVESFYFTCSDTPCSNLAVNIENGLFTACIPPGTGIEPF